MCILASDSSLYFQPLLFSYHPSYTVLHDDVQAERLWEILVPDEDEDTYIRSSSVPVKDDGRRGSSDILPLGTASAVGRRRQHPAERGSNTTNSRAAAFGAHYRRKNGVGGIAAGRLDIHGFLKLVDLLHEKVVAEDGEIEDGNSSSRRLSAGGCCSLAGYDNDVWEESATGDASRRMLERREDSVRVNFLWDLKDESGGQSGSGLDEYDTDTDGGSGESATRGSDDRGDHGRGKITTLALKVLKAARGFSINVVGRAWFLRVSQVWTAFTTICLRMTKHGVFELCAPERFACKIRFQSVHCLHTPSAAL